MSQVTGTGTQATPAMPVIFLAHGSPLLLDDEAWVGNLRRWADAMPWPRSVQFT